MFDFIELVDVMEVIWVSEYAIDDFPYAEEVWAGPHQFCLSQFLSSIVGSPAEYK